MPVVPIIVSHSSQVLLAPVVSMTIANTPQPAVASGAVRVPQPVSGLFCDWFEDVDRAATAEGDDPGVASNAGPIAA